MSAELTVEYAPFNVFPESEVRGLFSLAGIEITAIHEAANRYWGNRIETRVLCASSPWWIVETPHGVIVLGWRKRVLHIEWPSTPARVVVTEDNVTKCETHVHAYSKADAVKYLTTLAVELKRKATL